MPAKHIYEFGEFRIDPEERLLIRDGNPIPLTPKAFETLLALVENSGRVVKKDDLMNRVWPDAFVEEVNLAQNVSAIRRVLDTSGEQYIETVPKLGYRLIVKAKVIGEPEEGTDPSPASPMAAAAESASAAASPKKPRIKRRVTVVGLTAVLVAIGVTWRLKTHVAKDAPVHISSLAVLPLENLSKDPEQEYFADGMTDELTTDLAKIHALRVISRNSVMQYKGKHKPVAQIARELNVDAVVEGTVMHSGDRVRITAQLIAAPQDRHLWAETYEGDLRNVLALQDEVTTAIAKEISIQLTPEEQTQFAHARSVDPEGHQAYLRGLYEVRSHTVESNAKAIQHFQRAIAIDANDALAYEGLALAYMASPDQAPKNVMPKARAAALKAIELDDSLAEAHSSVGFIRLVFDWDWPGAEQELRRALELNPNSPLAHVDYARYLLLVPHRVGDAIQNCRRAYDLDPAVPVEHDDFVGFLFFARAYQAAIDEAAKEFEDNSPFLALAYAELGRRNEALVIADRAAASARVPSQVAQAASAYALAGSKQRAHELLGQLVAQANQHYLCGMNVAAVYSVLGEKDDAMAWLEKGYRDRSV
ncbi:MAG TPA: winged helix-turn-helix domain-containing protein [Terriglobales bacterium]|nr:winged helix-turn-helix domain-containing protein [Terriglobales bacterium]